jgi:hypothetical protein
MVDLAASLVGGLVVAASFFANPLGPAIRYDRALRLRRKLWISDAVTEAAPKTVALIRHLVRDARNSTPGCHWCFIDRVELSQLIRNKDHRRTSELVALVLPREQSALTAREKRHAVSLTSFAISCRRLIFHQ